MDEKTKNLLEQQLELLSEQSKKADVRELAQLSEAMAEIATMLLDRKSGPSR